MGKKTDGELYKDNIAQSSAQWYIDAMEQLVEVVQELSKARSLEKITDIIRVAARELTRADGATFILKDDEHCYCLEENAIHPLWKGKRFPIEPTCITGWVLLNGVAAIVEDIYKDPRIPPDVYRPTFVKSLVIAPIRKGSPIGAIGNYWATLHKPTVEEVKLLEALANVTAIALENLNMYNKLTENIDILEHRETRIREQHEQLETFTRALAHDLKEPVRTINAFADIILEEYNPDGKCAEYFQLITSASKRMLALIGSVYHFIQIDKQNALDKEVCDMNEIIGEVRQNLASLLHTSNAQIDYNSLPKIYGYKSYLLQLMQNLISNAIYHNTVPPIISIRAMQKDDSWYFEVSDNGMGLGINDEDTDKLFIPFKRYSKHSEGLGLGLPICKKIVELHGGKIGCRSNQDIGATFFFNIPISADANLNIPSARAETETKTDKPVLNESLANVLLVDDLKADLELAQIILKRAKVDCNLYVAASGKEAIQLLDKMHDQHKPMDLILLDINMPEMDGFETLEKVLHSDDFSEIPVIMCTGSDYHKDKLKAKDLGASGYLLKPFVMKDFVDIISSVSNLSFYKEKDRFVIQRNTQV